MYIYMYIYIYIYIIYIYIIYMQGYIFANDKLVQFALENLHVIQKHSYCDDNKQCLFKYQNAPE